tara:strand:+ start:233 stop:556 length:324 start_codon:yes stop_codon:yes gene_type:complete
VNYWINLEANILLFEIAAQINFLDSEHGGRNVPFGQGFSPKLMFNTSNIEYFTEFNIKESKTIFPGDQIKLELKIKGEPSIFIHKGASFDLFEGEKNIGNGTIMEIL